MRAGRSLGWFIAVLLYLLISGCSTQSLVVTRESLADLITDRVLLEQVPFFPQAEFQCGPAALATVLAASGVDVTDEQLTPEVYLPGREGTLQLELVAATRRYGRIPYVMTGTLENLLTELAQGNPVLVMQNLGFSWFPQWHYAVAVGYDLEHQTMTLHSGTVRRHKVPFHTFMHTWARADHWALVVAKRGEIPATADATSYLAAIHSVESLNPDAAFIAYQVGLKRWPREPLYWLALGNLHHLQRQYGRSADLFQRAVSQFPDNTALWNNYAYALRESHCPQAAISAIRCALRIQPDSEALQDSLAELAYQSGSESARCVHKVALCPTGPTN